MGAWECQPWLLVPPLLLEVVLVTFCMICCRSAMLIPTSLASDVLTSSTAFARALAMITTAVLVVVSALLASGPS